MVTDDNDDAVRRFTSQKAVRVRTAEGRSAPTSAQESVAAALMVRYQLPSTNGSTPEQS